MLSYPAWLAVEICTAFDLNAAERISELNDTYEFFHHYPSDQTPLEVFHTGAYNLSTTSQPMVPTFDVKDGRNDMYHTRLDIDRIMVQNEGDKIN